MRSIDNSFYQSLAWKRVRAAYIEQHPFCERCLANGIYNKAEVVHHRVHLTPENADDDALAYGFGNLEAVCRDCHNAEHFGSSVKRFVVDEDGNVLPRRNTV